MGTFTTVLDAGDKVSASTLAALITELRPRIAVVSTDQTLTTSSTTLQNITDLVLSVAANTEYEGCAVVAAVNASGTTEDVKYGFTFPAGATLRYWPIGPAVGITAAQGDGDFLTHDDGTTAAPFGAIGGGVRTHALFRLRLTTGANAGSLQMQAAQNVSGANAISIRLASYMKLTQVL